MKSQINKLPKSEIEIKAEVPAEIFESYREKAVRELLGHFEIPGFRKGKVPEKIFLEKVTEMSILEEMAELAISDTYPKLIEEHKLEPIGRPFVSITKIAKGNPLEFTAKTAVMPEIKLPDYKKIAEKAVEGKELTVISEEDTTKAIDEIRKSRAPKTETAQGEGASEPVLPELTDEFVKTLGNFENIAEFKEKVRENLKLEKERMSKEKVRIKIIDSLAEETKIDIPKIIIEEEKNRLVSQLKADVEKFGLKFEEYLKNIKKTEDDIKKEWEGEAVKRSKIEFILAEIAKLEKIFPTEEELGVELKHLLEHHKEVDENRAKLYLSQILTNQKVFEFLEGQTKRHLTENL